MTTMRTILVVCWIAVAFGYWSRILMTSDVIRRIAWFALGCSASALSITFGTAVVFAPGGGIAASIAALAATVGMLILVLCDIDDRRGKP